MSELKVIDVDKMADVRSLRGLFYRKHEADEEIQRLEKLCENYRCDCDNLAIMTDKLKKSGRSLRQKMNHQKYKRCMAMAKWCDERIVRVGKDYASNFYKRWHKRWLELSEKIKEAK